MASERTPGGRGDRHVIPPERVLHRQLIPALPGRQKPSRAKATQGSAGDTPPAPEGNDGAAVPQPQYEQARTSLVRFACAIDVPGRPVSEETEDPLFANIETALAPHHRLLLETVQKVVETPGGP